MLGSAVIRVPPQGKGEDLRPWVSGVVEDTEDWHPSEEDPNFWPSPGPQTPLTRQPQAQEDAVVDDRDDPSHTWGHRGALGPTAFKLLAQPTAVGCGQ